MGFSIADIVVECTDQEPEEENMAFGYALGLSGLVTALSPLLLQVPTTEHWYIAGTGGIAACIAAVYLVIKGPPKID